MQVIKKEVGTSGNDTFATYTFDTKHEYRVYNNGIEFAYTPKGNYTTQVTLRKLCRLASEYEDRRVQIKD